MEKRVSYSGIIIMLLVVAIITMSVGFAVYSSNLEINGTATVQNSNWNVEFDTDSFQETVGGVEPDTEPVINVTSVSYDVTLTEPGDFYEFTIDVANSGTFDAKLVGITMSDISTYSAYLKHTVTYGSTPYTTSQSGLSVPLVASDTETVTVRVEYVQPDSAADLPQTAQEVTLNVTLNYEQA